MRSLADFREESTCYTELMYFGRGLSLEDLVVRVQESEEIALMDQ